MTNQTEPRQPQGRYFVTATWPWVLGAGMFAVFLATLYHWITPKNLIQVADIAGWSYGRDFYSPLTFIITYPFRWLPIEIMPIALNLFSAVCATLTLVLLARSVTLLPHDRTEAQRQREQSEYSVLTIRTAWAPPLFAIIICGFQMTFWEHAIQAAGEMFDLLMFAYVIRCLLEYRITERESWFTRFALVYGLGMANNFAFIGFFPLFLIAVVWIKGLGAFQPNFISRMIICGVLGLSLVFFFPTINSLSHTGYASFGATMKSVFSAEKLVLLHFPRQTVLILALTSILPVFIIGIRWASYFGDNSPLGITMAKATFHIVHGLFLAVCLWVMLDSSISPRVLGYGLAFLPFYYLCALSIGYFIGYFLLIFGTKVSRAHRSLNPLAQFTNRCVLLAVWLAILALPAIQIRKNFLVLQKSRQPIQQLENYFIQMQASLPQQGTVVLSDDPVRLFYLEATANRHGKNKSFLYVDTGSLDKYSHYLSFLAEKNPGYQISTAWTNVPPAAPPALGMIQLMDHLSQNHELYYLHPSFGYYFEHFYAQPQGVVYRLKAYPTNTWGVPELTPDQIAENHVFWKKTSDEILAPLALTITNLSEPVSEKWGKLLETLHINPELNRLPFYVGSLYSRDLDNWGVELERAGKLNDAGKAFGEAVAINPYNVAARLNQLFNKSLLTGQTQAIQPPKDIEERLGGRRADVLNADGPIDEVNFRVDFASILADGGNYRQAVQQLMRAAQLAPDNFRPPLELAQLLIYMQTYTNALSYLMPADQGYNQALQHVENILKVAPTQPVALFLKGVALIQLTNYSEALPPLNKLLATQTNNYAALLDRAIAHYKLNDLDAAKADYTRVAAVSPKAYQVYYGLAEIADQQKDKLAAIKNYELYLTNAPTNTAEAATVTARLKDLKSGAP